jgi:hypothetical protein
MTPLFPDATRRVIPKSGHVRALQNEFTTADAYVFTLGSKENAGKLSALLN